MLSVLAWLVSLVYSLKQLPTSVVALLCLAVRLQFQVLGQNITRRTSRFFIRHCPPCVYPHVYLTSRTWLFLPGLPPPFLHTVCDQKLEAGTAWERGYENTAVKRWAFASVHIANVHYHLVWLQVKYLISIFTADCLLHPIQMAGVETIWELHTLIVMNSW